MSAAGALKVPWEPAGARDEPHPTTTDVDGNQLVAARCGASVGRDVLDRQDGADGLPPRRMGDRDVDSDHAESLSEPLYPFVVLVVLVLPVRVGVPAARSWPWCWT